MAAGSALAVLALVGAPTAQAAAPLSYATTTAINSEASMDWSGWDATAGSYTSVAAAWTVPAVTCTAGETSYSADWVGLDGDGSDAVEQIGTSSDCDNGTPAYSAWYEFYPAVSVTLSNTVRAGDKMTSSVTAVPNSDEFTVKLSDTTAKWTVSKTEASPDGSGASAEIIAEAPSGSEQGNSVLPLADFKKVTFSDVRINGTGIGSVAGTRSIAMVDSSGAPMATVSAVGGNAFDVTWVSSGADATAETTSGYGYGSTGSGSTGSGSTGSSAGSGSTGNGWGGGWSYPDGTDGYGSTGTDGYGSTGTDGYGSDGYGSTGTDGSGTDRTGSTGSSTNGSGTDGWGSYGYGYGYGYGYAGGWGGYWQS